MNKEWLTTRQTDHPIPEEQLEEMRAAIREKLEKTNKGCTANSISNCQLILRHDPIFKGKIRRNELTGCTDIVGEIPWQREGTLPVSYTHLDVYKRQAHAVVARWHLTAQPASWNAPPAATPLNRKRLKC